MIRCIRCNEFDDPLDYETGLCYDCWLLAGRSLFSMRGEEE